MDRFKQAIEEQIDRNEQSNLFFRDHEKAIRVGQDFLSILDMVRTENNQQLIDEKIGDYVSFAADKLIKIILSVNQYIQISPEQRSAVEQIYRNSWENLKQSKDIKNTLFKVHYPRLAEWLMSLYPSHFPDALQFQTSLNKLICKEYSPAFQLQTLGVDISKLNQPVLDIGCGLNANLVQFLRRKNIQIWGFDRSVENQSSFIKRDDWFLYDYRQNFWGTIISNAALSNHILYAAKNDPELFQKYRSLLQKILDSLKFQGSLILAPGNSFIRSAVVNDGCKMVNRQIVGEFYVTFITRTAL